jgi:hypothetical protein
MTILMGWGGKQVIVLKLAVLAPYDPTGPNFTDNFIFYKNLLDLLV